ncbi:head-tail joining protein [Stenotrophomonas nematodicola]|uniref:head-tail joining protein n=1 Tax=Stenotrophomonas nematodicola TaxID=2656746 RepID=UPI001290D2E1|nr:hypothetical protein [Stenotrophomonas nematodicola]
MSQKAFLAAFDAAVVGSFKGAGLADAALYFAPAAPQGAGVACDVMIDRGVQGWGDDPMPVAADSITVRFQRAQVVPEMGGILDVDGDRYRVGELLNDDGSMIRRAVSRV